MWRRAPQKARTLKKDLLEQAFRHGDTSSEHDGESVHHRLWKSIVRNWKIKIHELLDVPVDENRIAAEVILYADKICTDEETVRLKSHISHMQDTLEETRRNRKKA